MQPTSLKRSVWSTDKHVICNCSPETSRVDFDQVACSERLKVLRTVIEVQLPKEARSFLPPTI
jgi:hypothetical protein